MRRAERREVAFLDAVDAAVIEYSRALLEQLRQANLSGGWPDRLRVRDPRTSAERAALDAVLADLRRELPDVPVVMVRARSFPFCRHPV